jgi:hypothetical protein
MAKYSIEKTLRQAAETGELLIGEEHFENSMRQEQRQTGWGARYLVKTICQT